MAQSVEDTAGVYIVPAFTGLGAPYWNPYARGTVVGITRGCRKEHFVRATLESMAYQTYDILSSMEKEAGVRISSLRVDGGASRNDFLMQFQADILDAVVERPECVETTAKGAAYLAGLAVGFWNGIDELRANQGTNIRFSPNITPAKRSDCLYGWRRAVNSALAYAEYTE